MEGATSQSFKLAEKQQIRIFTSPELLQEIFDVIKRDKFTKRIEELKVSPAEIQAGLLHLVEIIRLRKLRLEPHEKPIDKDDEMFLLCVIHI